MDVVGGCAQAGTRREAITIASRCRKQTPIEIGVPRWQQVSISMPDTITTTCHHAWHR